MVCSAPAIFTKWIPCPWLRKTRIRRPQMSLRSRFTSELISGRAHEAEETTRRARRTSNDRRRYLVFLFRPGKAHCDFRCRLGVAKSAAALRRKPTAPHRQAEKGPRDRIQEHRPQYLQFDSPAPATTTASHAPA